MSGSRLMQLFDAAVELSPAARAEYLARECGADTALRARVEALLAADRTPAADAFDELVAPSTARLAPGTVVAGRYRIVAVRGEGGMGIVYEAEQAEPRRRVALKCLRPGTHPPAALQRFAREVELMARLRHPGIAQVHEAGLVDERTQQPFFAMEFVDGAPLLEALAGESTATRLEVFLDVCEAVQHAHGLGIVHRDLKPSNLLVERVGDRWQPKVLDFGIARVLADDGDLTRTHEIVGTLAYLGPEQFAARATASTRSDVWALGVTLYQLLAGRLPLAIEGLPLAVAAQRIATDEPVRIDRLVPALRGDLATIVHKALAKEPARRYANAGELAADLRRQLRHEPITARPPSAFYQASRFARRHRGLVGGVVVAFLALAVALAWSLRVARDEERQRVAAERLATDLRQLVRDVVFDVDEQLVKLPAATAARRVLVDAGRRYAEQLLERAAADPGLWFEVGVVLDRLAAIEGVPGAANLGDGAAAETLLRRGLELLAKARAAGLRNPTLREAIVDGSRDLAEVLRVRGQVADAIVVLTDLEPVIAEQAASFGDAAAAKLRSMVRPTLARLRLAAGDRQAAQRDFELHRDELQQRLAAGERSVLRSLSLVEEQLGDLLVAARDVDGAAQCFRQALAHAEAAVTEGGTPKDREQLALALQAQANFLTRVEGAAAAMPLLERARTLFADPALVDPANVQLGRTAALIDFQLGDAYLKAGDHAAAKPRAQAFLERTQAMRRQAPDYRSLARDLGIAHELLGRLAVADRDEAALEREFAAALAVMEERLRAQPGSVPDRLDLARTHGQLAMSRNTLANAMDDDAERARLYLAAAAALTAKIEVLQSVERDGKLPPDMQKQLENALVSSEQLRTAAAALQR
ncbi:MAG: serine/threonine protein kinase [Planctomycetes bacterium]|nr:serine/threonine protein kinase [Planctomycetota bacterium]